MHGMDSKVCLEFKKWRKFFTISLAVLLAASLMVLVYFLVLAPAISLYLLPKNNIHEGLSYYTEGVYLTYESGNVFDRMLRELDAAEKGQVVSFFHTDNSWGDNPFYGKMADVFAIDVQVDKSRYTIEQIVNEANFKYYGDVFDFSLYVSVFDDGFISYVKVIAVCDDIDVVRYIIVTDYGKEVGIDRLLISRSKLKWDKGTILLAPQMNS